MAKTPRTPVRYSRAIAEKICARLASGEPWAAICGGDDTPSYATLYNWMRRDPDFAEQVAAAREAGADYLADKAVGIAEAANKETVQRDRLVVATLLKRAALIAPRRAGKAENAQSKAPEPTAVVFRVRHFERVVAPDGTVSVREIKREDQA